jgi:hypothetical protein
MDNLGINYLLCSFSSTDFKLLKKYVITPF